MSVKLTPGNNGLMGGDYTSDELGYKMYKMRNKIERFATLSLAGLLLSTSPGFASSSLRNLVDDHGIFLLAGGAIAIIGTIILVALINRGKKSVEVEAYEAELERYRQSLRRG